MVKQIWLAFLLLGVFSPALFAQGAGLSFAISTTEGHVLPAVRRGLFDSFFEGSLQFDDFAKDFGSISGPWPGNGTAISLSYTRVSARLPLAYRLTLGAGHGNLRLPNGIGIFSDPTRLTVASVSLAAEVDVLHALPLTRRGDLRLSVTGGAIASLSHARLRSALLDVESRDISRHSYLRLELEAAPLRDHPEMRLYSALTAYPDGMQFLRLGVRLPF